MTSVYKPTDEQLNVISHEGHAFVLACPGAGKTRTMVERARTLFSRIDDRRGIAFLSFTNAAIDELEARLQRLGVLPTPLFPSFVGTFDRFLWHFLIGPFGVGNSRATPRLVPGKGDWEVKPFDTAQPLPLKAFERSTSKIIADEVRRLGFAPQKGAAAWETTAKKMIERSRAEGLLDFEDVRDCARERLTDPDFAARLGAALAGRFREVVVDEAQDCNPADLQIVDWLRGTGMRVKLICDPNQAIYAFRGGVTDELLAYSKKFDREDQLTMSGNFRSSPAICAAISQLRPPHARGTPDVAVGPNKHDPSPVYILSYGGAGVPTSIGRKFQELTESLGELAYATPVLASTWQSASKAAGRPVVDPGGDKTLLLADAVMHFHFAFEAGNRRRALTRLHRSVLLVRGAIAKKSDYQDHIEAQGLHDGRWRAEIIGLGEALQLRPGETDYQWLDRARQLLDHDLIGSSTIKNRLHAHVDLKTMLVAPSTNDLPARSIHSVKGLEFPAVCVVLTSKGAGSILDVLEGKSTAAEPMEQARKIYVAASRAERRLAIATPKSQANRLQQVLDADGRSVEIIAI
ncbi:ATP-dependent helicase [Methylocystis heyeri]|uniref:DNA 3'-5' helicase n=1 Tax=Methylocystis heyeri TaxID=391905 RepID=A0A6B8KMU3_9HYPH|nr:ATP-dependent helicase [Methylocystis heyeri]QGM48258.1 AAA family ATPase [Methylocystis heyeri]